MSNKFEFNAPQFINFLSLDDPEADSFFETRVQQGKETKNLIISSSTKVQETASLKQKNSENKEPRSAVKVGRTSVPKKSLPVLRKVLHEIVNHQIQNDTNTPLPVDTSTKKSDNEIIQNFEKLHLGETTPQQVEALGKTTEIFSSGQIKSNGRKSHHMVTRLDVLSQRVELNSQTIGRSLTKKENSTVICAANSENPPSSVGKVFKKMKRNTSPLSNPRKFISLAEQVEHFYRNTPERFRSKPGRNAVLYKSTTKPQACIPKTPNLATKFRQRKINFPDEKQREEMELEEMKKHQIKAHPLNEKILMGPSLNLKIPVIKKPATVPQPFSLTEVKKKEQYQEPVFHFKAQPVPSTILQGPVGIPPKKVTTPTIPTTPRIRVPLRFRVEVKTPEKTGSDHFSLPRNTKVEPFSFDTRMREMMQKKKEFIKRVIDEEKKSFSSFKAHPMPSFKTKCDFSFKSEKTPHKTIPQPFNLTQLKVDKILTEQETNVRITPFKARPAIVVHQKPFVPKLPKHEIILPTDFHLNTEKRALERQKFDDKLREKEEELSLALKLQKEEEEKLEKELALEERKKTEFKAKPMPRYRAFEIHAADPEKLTYPESPKFITKIRDAKKNETLEKN